MKLLVTPKQQYSSLKRVSTPTQRCPPLNNPQVLQRVVELDRYKSKEDELRVEDSIKEGIIRTLREENKQFTLKLAESQNKENRYSNEVAYSFQHFLYF